METLKINSQSRFLIYAIYFYRLLGISFGGITINKNGSIIKSPFWYHFGWLGFVIYSVNILYFLICIIFNTMYQSIGLTIYWFTSIMCCITNVIMFFSILFVNHKYGFKIMKMFLNDSLTKYSNLKLIKVIWIAHLIILVLSFIVQSSLFPNVYDILCAFCQSLLLMPLYYLLSFISWIVSMNLIENIKIIRKYLNDRDAFKKLNYLNEFNNYMLINYKIVNKIDNLLAFGFISFTFEAILLVMITVYYGLYAGIFNFLDQLIAFDIILQIQRLIQLILNCFINGKLYNESIKLLNDLDNINIDVNDGRLFETLIKFKTSVDRTKCGFTIGKFAPMNNFTLLKVNYNRDIIN